MRLATFSLLFLLVGSTLHAQPGMLTARQHLDAVFDDVKSNHGEEVRLLMAMAIYDVGGLPVALNSDSGTAQMWMYGFLSPNDAQLVTAAAIDNEIQGTLIGELGAQAWPEGSDTLYAMIPDAWWVDSDTAAMVWSTMAVGDFLESRPSSYPIGFLLNVTSTEEGNGSAWAIVAVDGADTLTCAMNALTTEALDCVTSTAITDLTTATGFRLEAAWPNPVRVGQFAEIRLTAAVAGPVLVEVYDLQGRLIGRVYDDHLAPGSHGFVIPAELLRRPGTYFIQARSATGIATQSLSVTR